MSDDTEKFFDDCRVMFLTEGWKAFMKEIEAGIVTVRVESLDDAEAFWKAKGRLDALHQIAGWQNAVLAAEEQAKADADAEAA